MTPTAPTAGTWYSLHPACRVRREKFGLLFYDLRGPRLLFAETGASLEPEDLREGLSADEAGRRGEAIPRFLAKLAAKGFLREQPVC